MDPPHLQITGAVGVPPNDRGLDAGVALGGSVEEPAKPPDLMLRGHPGSVAAMQTSLRAGGLYFAIVFAAGFVLGALRVLVLAPRLGELLAVLAELPVMLAIAWLVCGWLIERLRVPPRLGPRLVMGSVAFSLLIAAEVGLSMLLFGRSLPEFWASLTTLEGGTGLAGQLLFGSMPVFRG